MTDKPKTLGEVLKAASSYLAGMQVENPRLLCDLLAARLLNCKPLELPMKYNMSLDDARLEAMRRGIRRLGNAEPVQYITGQTEFMGHVIKTDRRALIPRPETELLVELILKQTDLWQDRKPAILEVGTGTGCITISLALAKHDAFYIALDVSSEAIELASENALLNGLKDNVAFAVTEMDTVEPETIDAVVANLPYIPTAEYEQLPASIKNHEPRIALDGGPDGLSVLEPVVQDASFVLKPGGFIFLEIGETQGQAVSGILEQSGFHKIQIHKDLNKRDRMVMACLQPL